MKTKKFLSVVIVVLMLTGILPFTAFASYVESETLSESDVYVGPDIIAEGYYLIDESGNLTDEGADEINYNVRFAPATETSDAILTLNNAGLSKTVSFDGEGNYTNVLSGGDLVVELIGENHSYAVIGFASMGSITFTGSGNLSFNSSTFENDSYIAYSASELIIEDSVKIVSQYNVDCGFYTSSSVTIKDNAEVSFPNIYGGILCYGGVTVSGNAKLTVHTDRFGIESYNSITISNNAVVDIYAFSTDISGYDTLGFYIEMGDLIVSDKAVLNVSSPNGKKTIGIKVNGNIIVSDDAKINASSGDSISQTIAVYQLPGAADYSALIIKDNAQVIANSGEIREGADYYPAGDSGSNNAVAAENIEISGNGKLIASCGAVKNIEDEKVVDNAIAVFVSEKLTVYDSGYISADTQECESAAAAISSKNISLYNKSVIDAETKECLKISYGITGGSLAVYNEAKINVKSGDSISSNSIALEVESLNATDDTVINASSSNGVKNSAGINTVQAVFEGNTTITASSGNGNESYGIKATKIIAGEKAIINASSGDALKNSYGIYVAEAELSGETHTTAVSGDAKEISSGFFVGDLTMTSNAVLNATGGKSDTYSIGAYSGGFLNITENSQLNAKAALSDTAYSFGIGASAITFGDSAIIESLGSTSAIYIYTASDMVLEYDSPYVIVSQDTTPENAVEWDGESSLSAYLEDDEIIGNYKYISISPAPVIHKVTYYLTAGGEVYETKTFAEGETIVHPVPETEPGITFVEWTDENGNPLPEVMGTEDIIAYAVLNVESYTVKYMVDGSVHNEYTVAYGDEVPIPDAPEKEGFIFIGWTPEIPDTMPANELTFIAVFEQKPEDIYNLGEESYRFNNFRDYDSGGHCFGMSITSAGYHIGALDIESVGGSEEADLYTLSKTEVLTAPICKYQAIQGRYSLNATVAGGRYYKTATYDIESDWNEVVNYVKSHEYDNKGTLQIGYRKKNQGGHAINFLRYEEIDGQPRIYAYDNNFPNKETYFYKDEATGNVYQGPYSTFSGSIDCIALRSVPEYFSSVDGYDATRYIYADCDTVIVNGAVMYYMDGEVEQGEKVMFEIPEGVEQVTIIPLVDNAEFTYLDSTYSFGAVDETTVGVLSLASENNKEDEFDFEIVNSGVAIRKPSTTTISCGDSIILHADISNIPVGGYVEWTASNDCFTNTVSEDGSTCKITSDSNGSTVFTVTIYDAEKNVVSQAEQTMTSNAGFFRKIIAFFKKIFGLTKTIPQIYKDIF